MCVALLALVACQPGDGPRPSTDPGPASDCPPAPSVPSRSIAERDMAAETSITIDPAAELGTIDPFVYGINHRYPYNAFGSWDPEARAPYERFVEAFRYAGFPVTRFPGGRMANPYRWQRAIGPVEDRGRNPNGGGTGQPFTNEFGPDEFGQLLDQTGAEGTVTANFATGSAAEAADWVEYMNTPVGENPNGGTAWADVRAENGHAEPYGIRHWEIGNELNSGKVYWIGESVPEEEKARKYIFGGKSVFEDHKLGTLEAHSPQSTLADGSPNFVRWARYPPVEPGSNTLYVDGQPWEEVDDITAAGAENVYEFEPRSGKVTFGDGEHGNIPPEGALLTLDYISGPHDGFLDFYREMKAVDPTIEIGSAIHTDVFTELMGSEHPYDFMVVHSYGDFPGAPEDPKDLHYFFMRLPDVQADYIADSQQQIATFAGPERAADIHVAITEYAAGSGLKLGINSIDAPEHYLLSLDGALYTASLLRHWVNLGIELAQKHSLVDIDPNRQPPGYDSRAHTADAAVLGPGPCFIPSASAHVFKMYTQLMGATRVPAEILGNPSRTIYDGSQFEALVSLATIDDQGRPALLIINRDRQRDVAASISVAGLDSLGAATIWTLDGPSYLAYNTLEQPTKVALKETVIDDVGGDLLHRFPANSVTAIRFDVP
jgi:alpha-N-arabinofuranosidase